MPVVLALLSYIAFGFCLPGANPGYSVFALLVLSLGALAQIIERDERFERFSLGLFFALAAGAVWLAISISDSYVREILAPSLIAGPLLFFQRPKSTKLAIVGSCLFTLIVWVMLFVPEPSQGAFFPSLNYQDTINDEFMMTPSGSVMDEYDISPVLFPANPIKGSLLFISLALTIVLLFTALFQTATRSIRNLILFITFIGCTGLTLLFGFHPAWIGGLCAILFSACMTNELWNWKSKFVVIVIGGVLAGFALISLQNPVLSFTPLPQLNWYWQARSGAFHSWGEFGAFQPCSTFGASSSVFASIVITISLFIVLVRRSIRFSQNDAIFPACISLALCVVLSSYHATASMFAHPLLWIALSFLNPRTEAGQEEPKLSHHDRDDGPETPIQWRNAERYAVIGLIVLMTAIGYSYLRTQQSFNQLFEKFIDEKIVFTRNELLDKLREISPYRPEGAALYPMHHLKTAISSNRMPDEETIQKIELCLSICARYQVAPLFAYKRLSDVYLVRADSGRALLAFERAVEAFPEIAVLRELYGDLLSTVGQYDESLIQFKTASNLQPTSSRLRSKIALIYKSVGKTGEYQIEQRKSDILSPHQGDEQRSRVK